MSGMRCEVDFIVSGILHRNSKQKAKFSVSFTMPRLSEQERNQAIGMLRAGMTAREVARRFNVHEGTVCCLQTRFRQTHVVSDRPRSGRPRVTTAEQDRHIRLTHLRNRQRPATLTADETPGTHNNRISDQTVRNACEKPICMRVAHTLV